MNTKDIIKLFIDSNSKHKVEKSIDYVNYFNRHFSVVGDWMFNSSIQKRIKAIVFENECVNNCNKIKQEMRNTLSREDEFNIDALLKDGKKWDRRIRGNQGIKSDTDILEYAVLLTTTLAKRLRNLSSSPTEKWKQYTTLLRELAEFLNIPLSSQILAKICPYNFDKEYSDWEAIINNDDCNNLKKAPITAYDILCAYLFWVLWHCNRASGKMDERSEVFEQWDSFVHERVADERILRGKSVEEVNCILEGIETIKTENGSQKNAFIPQKQEENDNELYRDKKYLRQSNLYKAVDLKAINRVLQLSHKKELSVLDLGCGDGEVTCSRFGKCRNFVKIIALDCDEQQIENARRKVLEKGIEEKVVFANLDMNSEGFIDELSKLLSENDVHGIDVIFAALSLHKANNPAEIVSRLSDTILNEGGFFVVREIDDDTKIYYSEDDISTNYITEAADEYKKLFGFSDRNCARKMYSWLVNSGLENVELFYDVVDTCNKTRIEKNDIFNIMVGFRKGRAEKELNKWSVENIEKYRQYESCCKKIISANNSLLKLFHKDSFWFLAINYIAVARKPITNMAEFRPRLKRDIELLLIRHAEGTYNNSTSEYRVNEEGRKQIEVLKTHLSNTRIDAVYSSSMKRAIESAEPIAETHNLKIEIFEELNEIDRGEIETDEKWGLYEEYYNQWKKHEEDLEFPNGENGEAVWLRAKYVIDSIIEQAKNHNEFTGSYRVCIFTHGGTIRSIVCGMLGIPQQARYQIVEEFDNCSITRIKICCNSLLNANTSNPFVMLSLNDTSYMRGEVDYGD